MQESEVGSPNKKAKIVLKSDTQPVNMPENIKSAFNWLGRDARGSTYTSYSEFSNRSACSFDFGSDGFTGSCNDGGELLHMTARSKTCGIVFARGDFDYSLYSCLARAQRKIGGKSTFGLKLACNQPKYIGDTREAKTATIKTLNKAAETVHEVLWTQVADTSKEIQSTDAPGSSFRLGPMIDRGCFNYRWPFNEYVLLMNEEEEKEVGTCTFFSFVKDGILYQVLRLEQVCRQQAQVCYFFPPISKIALTVGGTIRFRSFQSLYSSVPDKGKTPDIDHDSGRLWRCDGPNSFRLEAKVFQLCNDGQYIDLPLTKYHSEVNATSGSCVYVTRPNLPEAKKGYKNQTATFVAAFRLRDEKVEAEFPPVPSSEEIYDYVGIDQSINNKLNNATGAMWETIFLEKEDKTNSASELSEVSLIARCLERVLQVDLTPIFFNQTDTQTESLIILSNLFLGAEGCIKSLFWKVRFLVKVYNFLNKYQVKPGSDMESRDTTTRTAVNTPLESTEEKMDQDGIIVDSGSSIPHDAAQDKVRIAEAQLLRIDKCIHGVVTFLFNAYLKPGSTSPLTPDKYYPEGTIYYYVMITIWYVIKNYPGFVWEWIPKIDDWIPLICQGERNSCRLFSTNYLPLDNADFGKDAKERLSLLQWYHYGSIAKILQQDPNGSIAKLLRSAAFLQWRVNPAVWEKENLDKKVNGLRTAAKIALATKIASKQPYSAKDEIVDRLAFLARELDLEDPIRSGGSVANLAIRRIKQREFTREINPGLLNAGEQGYTTGPWEIHALCHHSRLVVSNLDVRDVDDLRTREQKDEEIEQFKRKFSKFLTSEASLVPCWERSDLTARRGWLRSEATSVLASTLLDICAKDIEHGSRASTQIWNLAEEVTSNDSNSKTVSGFPNSGGMISRKSTARSVAESVMKYGANLTDEPFIKNLLAKQLEALEHLTGESRRPPPIEWTRYCPPRQYHPEDFFNSVAETPDLYTYRYTSKIRVPWALRDCLRDKKLIPPEWKENTIKITGDLVWVSVIDIKARSRRKPGDYRTLQGHERLEITGRIRHADPIDALDSLDERHAEVQQISEEENKSNNQVKLTQKDKEALSKVLSHSLVDQEVQHRLYTIQSLGNDVLQTFVYVLHPEVVDCFSNHVHGFSRFSCQKKDPWVSRITLRSWSLANKKNGGDPQKIDGTIRKKKLWYYVRNIPSLIGVAPATQAPKNYVHSTEDDPISLPKGLEKALKKANPDAYDREKKKPKEVILRVSSIAISTNAFGDFSKCTIISEIIPASKLKKLGEEVQKLWQIFIHQPETARCLVFFLILGLTCQEIAREYEAAVNYFVDCLRLNDSFIKDESTWVQEPDSVGQLKLGLWSLESLYKLQNSLDASRKSIDYAKTELMVQVQNDPFKRSQLLERMCEEYLEIFERNLAEMEAIYAKLARKIELNCRYRDAMSAVLALRDNRNSFEQNSTIQKLTYLTIAYLPLGLVAAIFTIPDSQSVVFDNMGMGWFIGIIAIMMVFTFIIARILSTILRAFKFVEDKLLRHPGGSGGSKTFPDDNQVLMGLSQELNISGSDKYV